MKSPWTKQNKIIHQIFYFFKFQKVTLITTELLLRFLWRSWFIIKKIVWNEVNLHVSKEKWDVQGCQNDV